MKNNLEKYSDKTLNIIRIVLIIIGVYLSLTIIGIPIAIYIFGYSKKIKLYLQYRANYKNENNENYYFDDLGKSKSEKLFDEYRAIFEKHSKLREQIETKYSIAINQPTTLNKYTEECIELCLEDISLAPLIKEYEEKNAKIFDDNNEPFLGMYPSFNTLIKLYEKQGQTRDAILICAKAIKLGYWKDNTKGGMYGRIGRLIKKYNNENKTKIQFDYDNNNLYDEETGEIIK